MEQSGGRSPSLRLKVLIHSLTCSSLTTSGLFAYPLSGHNLIFTMETQTEPLSTRVLEKLIVKFLNS